MINLPQDKWTKQNYKQFQNELESLADSKYKQFHGKLIKDQNLIGIKIPILRNIAKKISTKNYTSFINQNTHQTYEETMLHGLVIGYLKIEFTKQLEYLDDFIPYITNWAICDCMCATLKTFKENQDIGYQKIIQYLNKNNPWHIRVGLVLLLTYYINDQYIDQILVLSSNITNDDYYVEMANAWLISMCYIKYQEKTIDLLKSKKLSKFTQNKAIDKIRDSLQIPKQEKENLKKYKYPMN